MQRHRLPMCSWFTATLVLALSLIAWPPRALSQVPCGSCSGKALRLHPANPNYFQETATGKPVLITSYSYKNLVPTTSAFRAYQTQINCMSQNNVRYTRVWHLLPWYDPLEFAVYWPWSKTAPGPACYGGDFFNLRESPSGRIRFPDPNYWDRMTGSIQCASEQGIASEIMLFDKSGMLGGNWTNNPWATDNNVNGFNLPSCVGQGVPDFYYTLDPNYDPRLLAAQKAYVRTMIDQTVNCNVIYEIENEHSENDGGLWAKLWGTFIKSQSPERLVSYSSLWEADLDAALYDSMNGVDVINRHFGPEENIGYPAILGFLNSYITTRWGKGKAINIDEFANGQDNPDRLRQMGWVIVTSGGHFHFEDPKVCHFRDTMVCPPPIGDVELPGCIPPEDVHEIVNNIQAFLDKSGWNFVGSKPATTLSPDQPYCMAPNPALGGKDYVCYNPGGHANSGIQLNGLPAGKYHIRWWNPRSGGSGDFIPSAYDYYQEYITGAPFFTTPPPNGNDWVLFVRQVAPGTESPLPLPHDVAVRKDDGFAVVVPGQPVTYTIEVTYPAVTARRTTVRVEDVFPAALAAGGPITWTCTATGGASCTDSGSGDIDETMDLFGGSSVTFRATGTLSQAAMGTLSNTATVTVTGPGGTIDPNPTNNSATDIDVIGGEAEGAALDFFTITPCRLVDTRNNPTLPILQALQTRDFAVAGQCGIAPTAKAVSLNVTVTRPGAAGYVRLVPKGDSVARNSTINYSAAETRANNAIVPLGADGRISAYVQQPAGTVVHLIIDVNGYFQ